MDGLAWWASLLSTAGIRLNTAYLHTTRIEFIQCAGKSLFLAYSGRIMSFRFFYLFFFSALFGCFPTLRIFQPLKFICKLINDRHLNATIRENGSALFLPANGPSLQQPFLREKWKVFGALKVVDRRNLTQTSSALEGNRGSARMRTQASF